MEDLRAAAKWLGVSGSGSKQKILDRLNCVIKREERRQAILLALEHTMKDNKFPNLLPSLRDDFTT